MRKILREILTEELLKDHKEISDIILNNILRKILEIKNKAVKLEQNLEKLFGEDKIRELNWDGFFDGLDNALINFNKLYKKFKSIPGMLTDEAKKYFSDIREECRKFGPIRIPGFREIYTKISEMCQSKGIENQDAQELYSEVEKLIKFVEDFYYNILFIFFKNVEELIWKS